MSNLIPPLLSSSPPPITGPLDEDDDDEFGDFRAATDSYCDEISLPSSPHKTPDKEILPKFSANLDINSNKNDNMSIENEESIENTENVKKDFQDRRKSLEIDQNEVSSVNLGDSREISENMHDSGINETISIENHVENFEKHEISIIGNEIKTIQIDSKTEFEDFSGCEAGKQNSNDENTHEVNNLNNSHNIKGNESEDDEFGDFESPIIQDDILETINKTLKIEDIEENLNSTNFDTSNLKNDLNTSTDLVENEDDFQTPNLKTPKSPNKVEESDAFDTHVYKYEIDDLKIEESSENIDNFGDFSTANHQNESFDNFPSQNSTSNKDISFGEFSSSNFEQYKESEVSKKELDVIESSSATLETLKSGQNDDSDDDFGDFASSFVQNQDEEFAEFSKPISVSELKEEEDDDFGDFNVFSGQIETPSIRKSDIEEINFKNAAEKSEKILKEVFPESVMQIEEYENTDETKNNRIFNDLKDITDSNALLYQWSKSCSQKAFLKSLNIDLRNILYGPSWGVKMPKFAANLSQQPLEPIKPEILVPTVVLSQNLQTPSPSISSHKSESSNIPSPQFDWSGSGLVNPLDSQAAEVASEESKRTTPATKQICDSFAESGPQMYPLRETYISNEAPLPQEPIQVEPTLLTPDLPRKEPTKPESDSDDEFDDFQSVQPIPSKEEAPVEEDEEFGDFQAPVLPAIQPQIPLEPLKPTIQHKAHSSAINWPNPGVSATDLHHFELNYSRKNDVKPEDEEWSDFVSVSSNVVPIKEERTSTPDLTLSVLNLGQVHPPKQPIPVITPAGLMQTKLPTNMSLPMSGGQAPSLLKPQPQRYQPSIISNQYAANLYKGANSNLDGFSPSHVPKSALNAANNVEEDEDDWSEFVSSQPISQTNGFGAKNWMAATPNIITNPLGRNGAQGHISSIGIMPDLDFSSGGNSKSKK